MADYPWFPMFVNLSGRRALIVGGGKVAARRAATLVRFCGHVTLVAPELRPEITALPGIVTRRRPFEAEDLAGADLVIAATDDAALNREIAALCRGRGVPVNVASDKTLCDFYFPGVAQGDGVTVGVTASGRDHRRAAEVTRRVQALLEDAGADEL